jgi:hypothetical protein
VPVRAGAAFPLSFRETTSVITTRIIQALGVCAVFGLAVSASAAEPTHRVYALLAQNGSAEVGTVALTAMGDKTRVDVALVGAPTDTPQPAHVHVGPCSKLDPKPTYGLTPVVDGVSSSTLDVPLSKLTSGEFAVNVHKSAAEIRTYVSCGDLSKK